MVAATKLGFLFPGQGSQSVGMLGDVIATEEQVRDTFAEASEAIGLDLKQLALSGPEETQNLTENTQPLILTASVAMWRLWQSRREQQPAMMAGHSLGEFTALVCANSLQFADAVRLVKKRGEFMQSAVPVGDGAMAAIIGLGDEEINTACAMAAGQEVVAAVNYNSPGQVVIAGHSGAVERAIAGCKEAGAKRAMALPVSAPFHTSLMVSAGEQLEQELAGLRVTAPAVPVIQNVYAAAESDPEKIKALLVEQISSPVQWTACISAMKEAGISRFIECGPGKVLSGLNRRIDRKLESASLQSSEDVRTVFA